MFFFLETCTFLALLGLSGEVLHFAGEVGFLAGLVSKGVERPTWQTREGLQGGM